MISALQPASITSWMPKIAAGSRAINLLQFSLAWSVCLSSICRLCCRQFIALKPAAIKYLSAPL